MVSTDLPLREGPGPCRMAPILEPTTPWSPHLQPSSMQHLNSSGSVSVGRWRLSPELTYGARAAVRPRSLFSRRFDETQAYSCCIIISSFCLQPLRPSLWSSEGPLRLLAAHQSSLAGDVGGSSWFEASAANTDTVNSSGWVRHSGFYGRCNTPESRCLCSQGLQRPPEFADWCSTLRRSTGDRCSAPGRIRERHPRLLPGSHIVWSFETQPHCCSGLRHSRYSWRAQRQLAYRPGYHALHQL